MNYGMVIDLQRCMGCQTCSTSCKLSNDVPDGIWWTRVLTDGGDFIDTGSGEYPQASMRHIPVSCQHCENPACVKVCPVGATYKDIETGIVRQDYDKCIGCLSLRRRAFLQLGGAELCNGLARWRSERRSTPKTHG